MKSKVFLAIVSLLFFMTCAQGAGPIPPVAWPNEAPEVDTELPVVEISQPSDEVAMTDSEVAGSVEPPESVISAQPSKIYTIDYTDGIVSSDVMSEIEIKSGTFEPNSAVDIWSTAVAESMTSPPFVWAEDLDPEKEKIQGLSWPDGSLEFKIISGYSPGYFTIYVSDGKQILSTGVTIIKAE